MTHRPKDPDSELFDFLMRIDKQLRTICEAGFVLDPDQIADDLLSDTGSVCQSLDALMAEAMPKSDHSTDLNEVVGAAGAELLETTGFPIVIATDIDATIPRLEYGRAMLLAVVLRAVHLGADHAGPGGQLHLSTSWDDSRAIVQIEATGSTRSNGESLPIRLRCISLADLMQSIGDDILVEERGDHVSLSLFFGIKASIT